MLVSIRCQTKSKVVHLYSAFITYVSKMNLDYLKLLYCEFQKYEVMTLSEVGGQPEKTRKSQL